MATEHSINRARTLRAAQTTAEVALWRKLRNRQLSGWKFRRQHPIDRFIVDFVALDGKLIIEIDGGTHSTDAEVRSDRERERILETLGFQILRFSNDDVRTNVEGVLDTILNELTPR